MQLICPLCLVLATTAYAYPYVDDGFFQPWKWDPWTNSSHYQALADYKENADKRSLRGLAVIADDDNFANDDDCGPAPKDACCIRCLSLKYCSVLNHHYIEDKYTPGGVGNLLSGSCQNMDAQASRLDVFGVDRSFRDNPTCRSMVYRYACLWWGSQNQMYDNRCNWVTKDEGAVVRPCRSLCVQVGNICANNLEWIKQCYDIPCPPSEATCTPRDYIDITGVTDECYVANYVSVLSPGSSLRVSWAVVSTCLALLTFLGLLIPS